MNKMDNPMPANLTPLAKQLRKNGTQAEHLLWNKLKSRQIEGTKFRRQQPMGSIIVDFVSFEKMIVIELDGGQHARQKEQDASRDCWLKLEGFTVLRFWNNEVFENLEGVLEVIRKHCLLG